MVSVSISVSQVVSSTTTSDEAMEVAKKKSLFAMSDTEILEGIYATHVVSHVHDSFDVHSLFSITQSIIKCSKQIIDNIDHKTINVTEPIGVFDYLLLHLRPMATQVHADTRDGITVASSFSTPLCLLKSIIREVPCKAPGEENAHDATLKILNKVSKYSWEAKAVLALAAFSLEYGEFWLTAQHQQSDQLAKSVAFLKGVPVLLKPENLKQRGQAVAQLNDVIMSTLQVIDCIFELEKLSITYNEVKELREILASARKDISVNVYWCIITTVACATNISLLTSDEDKEHDLVPYAQKIHFILNKLNMQLKICRKQVEDAEAYRRIRKIFRTPTEIKEVFKALIFSKDNVQPLIDGSTKQTVDIDILRKKNILLFLSSLEITNDDISILKPIYEFTKKEDQHKIVWIPIVEQWTDELQKKFETLRIKMPWYTVQISAPIAGIRFIKEEWNFKGKPTLVVMSPQGKVEHSNAFHMIRKEDEYIFFYGGKDKEWMKQFKEKATALANDLILKEAKINIKLFCVGKDSKGEDDFGILWRFWTGIESLFHTKIHKQADSATLDIQKLLSYKNEKDFDKWKGQVREKGFEFCFTTYYAKMGFTPCCRLDIPGSTGKVPDTMKCPDCNRSMETFISYKCCHIDAPNVHH
ncbi:unnamed protein product [Prunus armeniaca]